MKIGMTSYYEASARERLLGLLDPDTFHEFVPPQDRVVSPHLVELDTPAAFDDGIIVGEGALGGRPVLVAAQEGGFMGGAVGEVHGAKLVGLLQRALEKRPAAVLLLVESGGVLLPKILAVKPGVEVITVRRSAATCGAWT